MRKQHHLHYFHQQSVCSKFSFHTIILRQCRRCLLCWWLHRDFNYPIRIILSYLIKERFTTQRCHFSPYKQSTVWGRVSGAFLNVPGERFYVYEQREKKMQMTTQHQKYHTVRIFNAVEGSSKWQREVKSVGEKNPEFENPEITRM